jgi:hypothetical protein
MSWLERCNRRQVEYRNTCNRVHSQVLSGRHMDGPGSDLPHWAVGESLAAHYSSLGNNFGSLMGSVVVARRACSASLTFNLSPRRTGGLIQLWAQQLCRPLSSTSH